MFTLLHMMSEELINKFYNINEVTINKDDIKIKDIKNCIFILITLNYFSNKEVIHFKNNNFKFETILVTIQNIINKYIQNIINKISHITNDNYLESLNKEELIHIIKNLENKNKGN